MNNTKTGLARPIAALVALFPCLYCILFSKWLGVEVFYLDADASLWKIGKLFKQISEYAEYYGVDQATSALTAASIFLYALLAFALVMIFITVRSILQAFQSGGDVALAGFWGSMLLSGVIIILVLAVNGAVSKETDELVKDAIKLRTAPYLTLICSIAGCLLCKYLPENALQHVSIPNVDPSQLKQSAQNAANKVSSVIDSIKPAGEPCAYCGKHVPLGDFQYCPYCGKERVTKRFCEECGQELSSTMQFCPNCGTPVRKTSL